MSKLQDLIGTSLSYFKIGKTGPRIKNNAGELESRNNADSAYANFTMAILGLFSNSTFKTLLQSAPSLASNLKIVLPSTKGSTGQVLVGAPDPLNNEVVLSFQNPPAGIPVLDNISLVKQGIGRTEYSGGAPTDIFSYLTNSSVFALGGSRNGASWTAPFDCELTNFRGRYDNGFNNTGSLTAYLVQITGTVLGSTPTILATSINSPAFTPGTFPAGVPTNADFNFANIPLTSGIEYAVLVQPTAQIFSVVGTNQAGSTNYTTTAAGANFQAALNQNTLNSVITVEAPEFHFLTDESHFIGVRGLPLNYNEIAPFDVQIDDGQVAYVTIDRGAAAPTLRTVNVVALGSFVPNQNNVIIARRVGASVYYGLDEPTIIPENSSINLELSSTPYLEIDMTNKITNLFAGVPFNLGTTGEGVARLTRIGKTVFGNITIFFDTDHDLGAPVIISNELPFPVKDPGLMIGRTQGFSYILVNESVPGVSNDAFIFPVGCVTSNVGGPEPAIVFVQLSESLGDGGPNNVYSTINPVDLTGRSFTLFASIQYEEA